jgi:hypothetical protein
MRTRQGNSPLPPSEEFAMFIIVWRFRWAKGEVEIHLIFSAT